MTSLQSHGNPFYVTVKAMDDMQLVPIDAFEILLKLSLCLHESMSQCFSASNFGISLLRTEKRGERREGMKEGEQAAKLVQNRPPTNSISCSN